ncbi:hypothetical protein RKD28_006255 [Streptomyces sp. SAI-229]
MAEAPIGYAAAHQALPGTAAPLTPGLVYADVDEVFVSGTGAAGAGGDGPAARRAERRLLGGATGGTAPVVRLQAGQGPVRSRSRRAVCSTLRRSSGSSLGAPANQASRISVSSGPDVSRRPIASTLASFQRRAPSAV